MKKASSVFMFIAMILCYVSAASYFIVAISLVIIANQAPNADIDFLQTLCIVFFALLVLNLICAQICGAASRKTNKVLYCFTLLLSLAALSICGIIGSILGLSIPKEEMNK